MTNAEEDVVASILDELFHGCAFSAFLIQAQIDKGPPHPEKTRQIAYDLYEDALAEKNGRRSRQSEAA